MAHVTSRTTAKKNKQAMTIPTIAPVLGLFEAAFAEKSGIWGRDGAALGNTASAAEGVDPAVEGGRRVEMGGV